MKNIHIRKLSYNIRRRYITTNNAVIIVALFISASWVWGSVQAMDRNYQLQKEVDYKRRELQLARLETQTLKFEQNYLGSDEYRELAVRERVGLANPGEKVLILAPNSKEAMAQYKDLDTRAPRRVEQSNVQQWANFLFGGSSGTPR